MIQLCQSRYPQHSPHSSRILFEDEGVRLKLRNNDIFEIIFMTRIFFEGIKDIIESPDFKLEIANFPLVTICYSSDLLFVISLELSNL